MPQSRSEPTLGSVALTAIVLAILIMGLYFGASFLIPIVIAVLITILLSAAADRLQWLGVPAPLAMVSAVVLFIVAIVATLNILAGQTDEMADAWPGYAERLNELAEQFLSWAGPGFSENLRQSVQQIELLSRIPDILGSAGSFAATIGLIVIYVAFLLLERGRLKPKIERLAAGGQEARQIESALDQMIESIRRYLWIKTILSVLTAGLSYGVLKAIGVDFAETWAVLIFLLNYIPSIGSVLGVAFPAVLALIQFETYWQFFVIAILLASVQFFIGNVVEPRLLGRSLNLSPFAVIASLAFWGMMWGVVGAFLSVPMTTAFVIMCGHIPSLRWIAILLLADGRAALAGEETVKA